MAAPVKVALIGGGLMGSFHAETLARRLPSADFVALADPLEEPARALLGRLGLDGLRYEPDYQTVLADPEIEAVVIATPGATHPAVISAAAEAGKAVFCEKPLGHALEPADAALAAVARAGTLFQLGFQRRFDAGFQRARALVADGSLGRIELLRSLTRDPARPRPEAAVPWAIFRETLIHDFDVLRWLAGSEAVELYAQADAFAATNRGEPGALDTALVQLRFANGALASADASFQAAYGYDVRAEVFGSAGMVTVGDGRLDSATHYSAGGVGRPQAHWFQDLFAAAYTAELAHFVECVRTGAQPAVGGQDGRASLAIAVAAIESIETGRPVRLSG
jgi:myo-inositol 2-dehydrogenase / D-chiro-inositol 1-dehydrogenase